MPNEMVIREDVQKVFTTLEEYLDELSRYGKPRLGLYGGWSADLDMFVTGKGTEFKITSGFDHTTPLSAVAECHSRLIDTLRGLQT